MRTYRSVLKIIVPVKFRGFYSFCINSGLKSVKGALSSVRQFLTTGNPLKMMKHAFYSTLKALFVVQIFKFFS